MLVINHNKDKKMKTLVKTTSLIVTLTILFSFNLSASLYTFTDEAYIDDIPFNTSEIYNDIVAEQNLTEFNFEEEDYINDMPFDTECVTADCLYEQAVAVDFQFEEEPTIDDITVDTECISSNCLYQKAMLVEFNFEDEETINDIGF